MLDVAQSPAVLPVLMGPAAAACWRNPVQNVMQNKNLSVFSPQL